MPETQPTETPSREPVPKIPNGVPVKMPPPPDEHVPHYTPPPNEKPVPEFVPTDPTPRRVDSPVGATIVG
jgi:hypothetical protein